MGFPAITALSALGQAFGGYAQDREDQLKRMMLQRQLQGQDFDRDLALRDKGYVPTQPGQAGEIAVPQSTGPQSYVFDYDHSPQGLVAKRMEQVRNAERTKNNQFAFNTLQGFLKNDPNASQNELVAPFVGQGYNDQQDYADVFKRYMEDVTANRSSARATQQAVNTATALLPLDTQKMMDAKREELKNAKTLEDIRSGVQQMLQHNQQQFELGKLTQQQKFDADQQAARLASEFVNQSALTFQREGTGLFSGWLRDKPSTTPPSVGGAGPNMAPSPFESLVPPPKKP
jgi:hypothetical protein